MDPTLLAVYKVGQAVLGLTFPLHDVPTLTQPVDILLDILGNRVVTAVHNVLFFDSKEVPHASAQDLQGPDEEGNERALHVVDDGRGDGESPGESE